MATLADQIKEWEGKAAVLQTKSLKDLEAPLAQLDSHLTLRSYIVGHAPTEADTLIWQTLRGNPIARNYVKQGYLVSLSRWFSFIEDTVKPEIPTAPAAAAKDGKKAADSGADKSKKAATDEGASFDIGLQDTSSGVVTRFPPEPSGYLHIGHAKAALLNDYFAHKKYNGKLLLRFDDTNPLKEKQEFEDSIVHDLELLGVKPDELTHTSDYFQELYEYCVKIIELGHAYADDTPQEQLQKERMARVNSVHRDDSVKDSLARLEEMKTGSEEGQRWFIRAKIDMQDNNGAMRDPVIYRCSPHQPHHRTGTTWKIYPTYDFACPLVDALEKVTHALRTTEYNDRDAQYQWMLKALGVRHVYNWNFARLSFIRTFLSKRKLTKVVDSGLVWGWDDPRFPTVRGIRRRGMTVPALQEFILRQGPSKSVVLMDWTTIWATNKKYIDPVAARYTAVEEEGAVTVEVYGEGVGAEPTSELKDLHAKNKEVGQKKVVYSKTMILDQADAASFDEGEEITLMNWGNAFVRDIVRSGDKVTGMKAELNLGGDVKKTKKKITWLSKDQELTSVYLYDFDFLLTKDKLEEDDDFDSFLNRDSEKRTKCFADCNVANLQEDDIIQFDRKGFFRCDKPAGGDSRSKIGGVDGKVTEEIGQAGVFFNIPTGKNK